MPITAVEKNTDELTLTITADFAVDRRRLWDAYSDPRRIEQFWGPPEYPATFHRHDMATGGLTLYSMTGPEGDTHYGFWEYLAVEEPSSFEVVDGFCDADGERDPSLPTMRMVYRFDETDDGSRLVATTYFNSAEELEQLLEMGMEEGTRAAMGQIDAVLADAERFAAGSGTTVQSLTATTVRLARIVSGTPEQVWRAHHDPDQLRRWMLGPDGWSMTRCEVPEELGAYHYEWTSDADERFGFTGEVLESRPPLREVTTERLAGTDGPTTSNVLTLTPLDETTLVTLHITYPDAEVRDQVLETGMADGLETSYARLEQEVLAG